MKMDEELLTEFLTESNENMASIEEQLMELEASPEDEELVNAIFRVIHTVKGSCAFLGLSGLEKLAHAGENLLGKIRSLKFPVNEDIVSLLLACADGINAYLQGLEENGVEPELDHSAIISRLQAAERLVERMSGAGGTAADDNAQPAAPAQVAPDDSDRSEPMSAATDATGSATECDDTHGDIRVEDWIEGFDEDILAVLTAQALHTPEQVIKVGFAALRGLDEITPADALKLLGLAKVVIARGGVVRKQPEKIDPEPAAQPIAKPVSEAVQAAEPVVKLAVIPEQAAPVATSEAPAPATKPEASTADYSVGCAQGYRTAAARLGELSCGDCRDNL